jgi:hypothetical protein
MAAESSLIIWARGLAERAAADPIIKAALRAAEMLRKVVVQTPEDAQSVTTLLNEVRKGKSNAKKSLDDIVAAPKEAIAEAKAHLDPIIKAFEKVESCGKDAVARFLLEQEAQAKAAERKAQEEAEAVARAATVKGETVPAMEPEPVAVQTIVRAESGASSYLVKRLAVEMVNAAEVAAFDPSMLKLVDSEALLAYRYHEARGTLDGAKEHPSGGVEWHGCRFYFNATAAQRGGTR